MKAHTTILLVGALLALGDAAGAQETVGSASAVKIGAESVAAAIHDWSEKTGYSVSWGDGVDTTVVVTGIDGTFTPLDALARLLDRTTLRFRVIGAHSVSLSRRL